MKRRRVIVSNEHERTFRLEGVLEHPVALPRVVALHARRLRLCRWSLAEPVGSPSVRNIAGLFP